MSNSSKRIYKITINNRDIVFNSRSEGERGRDIVAVKYALGDIYQAPTTDNSPDDTSIGTQWFSCEDNKLLSVDSLVTFDKKLKTTLMNFQINNQILILNYYWEKMDIAKDIKKETDVYTAIQFSLNQFDANFGRIDEATIAVLHGWRPSSTPSNRSFFNSEEHPVEELPRYFYELITQGIVARPPEGIIRRIVERRRLGPALELMESFNNSSQEFRKWASRSGTSDTYFFEYVAASVQGSVVDSALYVAASQTLSDIESLGMDELTPSQRSDLIAKAIEPSHLTTRDPFEITNFKIGFFNKTEYTFQNLPEFGDISLELKASLELSALEKVSGYYGKHLPDQVNPELINFIDFRAPSLRPGDVYRAYFEINKTILDDMPNIEFENLTPETISIIDNKTELEQELQQQRDLFCVGGSTLTDEQTKIQYEKYRSFAAKKKLEISRKIRQAALKSQEDQLDIDGIEVDLGIFGKGSLTQSEMTGMLTQGVSGIAGEIEETRNRTKLLQTRSNQNLERNSLLLPFPDFKERCEEVSKNFSAAAKDLENFRLETNGKIFDALEEARNIAKVPADIESSIRLNPKDSTQATYAADVVKQSGRGLKEVLAEDTTEILITFEDTPPGPEYIGAPGSIVKDMHLVLVGKTRKIGKIYDESDAFSKDNPQARKNRQLGKIKGSLLSGRTMNYIRNIEDLSSKNAEEFSGGPCNEDPLTSKEGYGTAYILKYTKGVTETKSPNTYNPYHNWVEQRKSDITEGIKKRLPNQDTNSPEYKLYNVTSFFPEARVSCTKSIITNIINNKEVCVWFRADATYDRGQLYSGRCREIP